jgi:tetratricopeptide (TPR) repeat protein
LVKSLYRLQAYCFVHYRKHELALQALERLKDISEDSSDFPFTLIVWRNMADIYAAMKNKSQEALFCLQSMLQYAWLTGDRLQEVDAYQKLAQQFFNQSDLAKADYYHTKAMNQETEDPSLRVVEMAKLDITMKQKRIERNRMIEVCHEQILDAKGNTVLKMHRVRKEMDYARNMKVEFDVADYTTAEAIRKTAEEYIM